MGRGLFLQKEDFTVMAQRHVHETSHSTAPNKPSQQKETFWKSLMFVFSVMLCHPQMWTGDPLSMFLSPQVLNRYSEISTSLDDDHGLGRAYEAIAKALQR